MHAIILAFLMMATPAFSQEPPAEAPEAPVSDEAIPEVAEEAAEPLPSPEPATDVVVEEAQKSELVIDPPETTEEALEDAQAAVSAAQKGMWGAFGALLMGLLVFVWNKFLSPILTKKEEETE